MSVSKSEVFSIDDHDYDFETQSIGNTLNKEYVKFVNKKHIQRKRNLWLSQY